MAKGGAFNLFLPEHDLQGVAQAGVGQRGQLVLSLHRVLQVKNVAQGDPHQFSLMITPQPEVLVFIGQPVPQVGQDDFGVFAPAQLPAQFQFVHQVGGANGHFGQKLGAIEQEQQQLEQGRIRAPGFIKHGPGAIDRDETVQPRQHPVRVGQKTRLGSVCRGRFGGRVRASWPPIERRPRPCGPKYGRSQDLTNDFSSRQDFSGSMNAWPAKILFHSASIPSKSGGKASLGFSGSIFDEFVKNPADVAGMLEQHFFKSSQTGKAHQRRQPFPRLAVGGNGVGLAIIFHLQPMLDLTQKTVRFRQRAGFGGRQKLVIDQFLER